MIRQLIVSGFALFIATVAHSVEVLTARVVGIADGDTITVLDASNQQHKGRLAGIDAPEKKQPFGQRSKEHLSALVFGKEVVLDCGKVDRYRREICVVLINGKDANLAQVEAGMAWWYRKYAKEQTARQRVDYESAETRAKALRNGLRVDQAPMPPWEWRHGSK